MKRILFAGENQPLWGEFESLCQNGEAGWTADFARTGPEAVAALGRCEYAAVVSDVDLSGGSGLELLDETMRSQPKAMRIVLSDMADTRSTVKCLGRGHHHLLKPCDTSTVLNALNQALALETWLPSQAVQALIAKMRRVPSPPTIYFQVLSEMQSPHASLERIGGIISQDPAITAKVLQLANSAVFGLQLRVIQPLEAVIYIGLETTRSLVLMAHTFSSFDQLQLPGFSIDRLWGHCVLAGRFAREIAQIESGDPEIVEQAFAAGLLHDIGKLLFAANLPEAFRRALALAREQQRSLWEAESQVLGACHAELGACLLGIWGLPAPIVEAVALHHYPAQLSEHGFCPLTAVHVADVLAHELGPQRNKPTVPVEIDPNYLQGLGLTERVETWRENCQARDLVTNR
jgi:HD-like signal output (HDOD) protein/CheY-like chemotaxis protein